MKMTMNDVLALLAPLVREAERAMPGASGKEKKQWVVSQAVALVERYDHMLPVIGAWADLPVVDAAQRWLIGLAVERAWVGLNLPTALGGSDALGQA